MNLNNLARSVTEIEGGARNLSIAQVAEVIRCVRVIASQLPLGERKLMAAQLITAPKPKRGEK